MVHVPVPSKALVLLLIGLASLLNQSHCHHVAAYESPSLTRRKPLRPTGGTPRLCSGSVCRRVRRSTSTHMSVRGGATNASSTLSYYLLWSPTMLRKTTASFLAVSSLRQWGGDGVIRVMSNIGRGSVITTRAIDLILLPLLSSACCSIQLLINIVVGAGGCAGFNKHLGPLRPYFLGILLSATVPMIMSKSVTNWTQLGVQFLMAFLPELVHMWNTFPLKLSYLLSRVVVCEKFKATGQGLAMVEAELNIPGMGCVACINKINGSLQQVAGVKGSQAWLENNAGGKAKVQYSADSDDGIDEIATKLVDAVRGAGFDTCSIARIQQVIP